MSEHHVGMKKTTPLQFIIAALGGLIAPVIAIYLIVQLVMQIQGEHLSGNVSEEKVLANIAPVGEVRVVDANAPRVERSGQEVYDAVCISCHGSGALGAPKLNSAADWSKRISQGYDTLIKHAIEGIRAMPPRGGDPELSDVEVARAVAYMANSAGAKFTPPEPQAAAPAQAAAQAAAPEGQGSAEGKAAAPAAAATTAPAAGTAASAPAPAAAAPGTASPSKPAEAAAPAAAEKVDVAKGKAVYDQSCAACHATGAAGAPKVGDKAAWAPRIKSGKDTLYASALNGKGAMPAKGGFATLADADVKAAVDYMVSQSK